MVEGESRLEQRAGALDSAASGILMGGAYLFVVFCALQGSLSAGAVVLFCLKYTVFLKACFVTLVLQTAHR